MSDTKMVTVKVSGDTKSKLDKLCEENGLKMRWVVEQAIIEYCKKHPPKSKYRMDIDPGAKE